MDFVSSALQCDQIDELLEFSSIPCQQRRIQKDPLQVVSSSCNADVAEKPDYHPSQKSSVVFDDRGRRSYIEKLRDKDGKKWLPVIGLYGHSCPLNMSRFINSLIVSRSFEIIFLYYFRQEC